MPLLSGEIPTFIGNFPAGTNCEHCRMRHAMQQKYLREAHELYEEFFHIVQLPLLTDEVRGPERLKEFSKMLVEPFRPDV